MAEIQNSPKLNTAMREIWVLDTGNRVLKYTRNDKEQKTNGETKLRQIIHSETEEEKLNTLNMWHKTHNKTGKDVMQDWHILKPKRETRHKDAHKYTERDTEDRDTKGTQRSRN